MHSHVSPLYSYVSSPCTPRYTPVPSFPAPVPQVLGPVLSCPPYIPRYAPIMLCPPCNSMYTPVPPVLPGILSVMSPLPSSSKYTPLLPDKPVCSQLSSCSYICISPFSARYLTVTKLLGYHMIHKSTVLNMYQYKLRLKYHCKNRERSIFLYTQDR